MMRVTTPVQELPRLNMKTAEGLASSVTSEALPDASYVEL